MRKNIIYTLLAMVGLLFSCQKPELTGPEGRPEQGTDIGDEATVSFSAILPAAPDTKAMGSNPTDIETMHLVVFDGNGMYVETREASNISVKAHDGHNYEATFEVTLSVTDQPRNIHFIANCPVEQISYGHEASVIGNMFVTKADSSLEEKTEFETAYWARIEVPYILVEETEDEKFVLVDAIANSFKCIPMLRNFAQVTVIDGTPENQPFEFLGFTLYNTIDIGTVAPYNNATQSFQNFVDPATGQGYKYPKLDYKGHALSAAELNTSLERVNGDYKWYGPGTSFYMYERKISVKTSEEDKWRESPPHVIIKGSYNGQVCYYKVDLVYNVYGDEDNPEQVTDIVYYNILRNFRYQFTIKDVAGEGYKSVEEAIIGATSNNLSGSATTTKFTNISDEVGRIWVSYTDTTLVNSNQITLKYKYVKDITSTEVNNDLVTLGGVFPGDVISSYRFANNDVDTEHTYDDYGNIIGGEWDGFREVVLTINEPQDMTKEQAIMLRTDNANLSREVRYYLKKKYPLEVECTPKVEARIGAPVEVDIKLPVGLTDDMFPLDLDVEVYDMTLSPDASQNTLPVVTGPSVISSKAGQTTFHFVKTIETKAEYDAIPATGAQKVIKTFWLTNMAANASRVYVHNKYFEEASDNFVNVKYAFADVKCTPSTIECGLNKTVTLSFNMDTDDASYASRTITVVAEGAVDAAGNSTFVVDRTASNVTVSGRTVTISGLLTTTGMDDVSFTIDADEYAYGTAVAQRQLNEFNGSFEPSSLGITAGEVTTYSFSIPSYTDDMLVNVTLVGLKPADDETQLVLVTGVEGAYTFDPRTSGNKSFRLQTINAAEGTCSITLEAEDYYYRTETDVLEQVDKISITGKTVILKLKLNHSNPGNYTINPHVTIGGDASVDFDFVQTSDASYTGNNPYNFTINLRNFTISDADEDDEVTITCTMRRYSTYTYTMNMTVRELLNAFGNSSSATFDLGTK